MSFIDELIGQGGLPYGMEFETPKAHDEIDSLLEWDDSKMGMSEEDLMNLVIGTVGGGGIKGIPWKKLLENVGLKSGPLKLPGEHYRNMENIANIVMKGKIKGGKMVLDKPLKPGMIGKLPKQDKVIGTVGTPSPKIAELYPDMNSARLKMLNKVPALTKEIQKGGKGELVGYLLAMLAGGAAGTMAQNIPAVGNISDRLAEFLAPDPQWLQNNPPSSKESLDMYFEDMIRDRGRPADPEMWEMGEPY